jgi:hypothetical protein
MGTRFSPPHFWLFSTPQVDLPLPDSIGVPPLTLPRCIPNIAP